MVVTHRDRFSRVVAYIIQRDNNVRMYSWPLLHIKHVWKQEICLQYIFIGKKISSQSGDATKDNNKSETTCKAAYLQAKFD